MQRVRHTGANRENFPPEAPANSLQGFVGLGKVISPMLTLRPWNRPDDTVAVQQLVSRLWPLATHPGGLGWEAASDQLPTHTMLAERDGRIVGWAGVTEGDLTVQASPDDLDAAPALLNWAIEQAAGEALNIVVFHGDLRVQQLVTEFGFARREGPSTLQGMFRKAASEGAVLPEGYRFRGVRDGEEKERVAIHQAAWRPATMPWPDGSTYSVDPALTSRFTDTHFEQVRRAWLYDQQLDFVVEAPDGTLAACCTAWWDPTIDCAEIEPLGVAPEHRRKGLATALCMEVCTQVAIRGGIEVFINTAPNDDYPAPPATYLSAGFIVRDRGSYYDRRAPLLR